MEDFKVLDGMNTYYYPNGVRMANGKGLHGLKLGVWIYFDRRGKISHSRMEIPSYYVTVTEIDHRISQNFRNKYPIGKVLELLESDTEDE